MIRGALTDKNYKPQFTGHETFPMRYGWLKKVYDAAKQAEQNNEDIRTVFKDEAIAHFGVGKNMVSSMRHWALACNILSDQNGTLQVSSLGKILFEHGNDPYLENPDSLWLLHWQLAGIPKKTTWYWAYNYFPHIFFDRETLTKALKKMADDQEWPKVSEHTIKRDVECFVRTYVPSTTGRKQSQEEALECPLTELGLIKPIKRGQYEMLRIARPTLSNTVFAYALVQFWQNYTQANTLSFEAIAHEPGSPGRVFLLEETELAERLIRLEDITNGAIRWSETAGLKQLTRVQPWSVDQALEQLTQIYQPQYEVAA